MFHSLSMPPAASPPAKERADFVQAPDWTYWQTWCRSNAEGIAPAANYPGQNADGAETAEGWTLDAGTANTAGSVIPRGQLTQEAAQRRQYRCQQTQSRPFPARAGKVMESAAANIKPNAARASESERKESREVSTGDSTHHFATDGYGPLNCRISDSSKSSRNMACMDWPAASRRMREARRRSGQPAHFTPLATARSARPLRVRPGARGMSVWSSNAAGGDQFDGCGSGDRKREAVSSNAYSQRAAVNLLSAWRNASPFERVSPPRTTLVGASELTHTKHAALSIFGRINRVDEHSCSLAAEAAGTAPPDQSTTPRIADAP